MKGISTILAMILIVIIVVALIGLTYTFAVGLFATTTEGATEQTETVTEAMQKSVNIVSGRCNSTDDIVNFTVKNTGTKDIVAADLGAFISEMPQTFGVPLSGTLTKGSLSNEMGIDSTIDLQDATQYVLKISAPAADVTYKITCAD